MIRVLKPELLDTLSPDDPAAIHSRRDLRLINAIMGNNRWLFRNLIRLIGAQDALLELGAGCGDLGLYLYRKHLRTIGIHYTGIDLMPRPVDWPAHWDWLQEDLLKFDAEHGATVLIANLILHHFNEKSLSTLGENLMKRIRVIIACEPARHPIHQWQLHALRLLGINAVTRHDARVSVAAGFRGNELAEQLGLSDRDWSIHCHSTFFGAYRFVAVRR